jgi:hypothetical protein
MTTQRLRQLLHGFQLTRVVTACAELNIPDLVRDEPRSIDYLAEITKTQSEHLSRLLRAAVTLEILSEPSPNHFALGIHGQYLCSDHPENLKAVAVCFAQPWVWQSWGQLTESVKTGQTGIELFSGEKFFDYLAARPEAQSIFSAVMASGSSLDEELAACLDFSGKKRIADIGGARGTFLCKVIQKWPQAEGIIFDLPSVKSEAGLHIESQGLKNRVSFEGGDFFKNLPLGCDCFLLRYILHDWNDNQCRTILKNCYAALPPGGSLIIVDTLMSDAKEHELRARLLDINMMIQTGGRERTESEFTEILKEGGFMVESITRLQSRPGMAAMLASRRAQL